MASVSANERVLERSTIRAAVPESQVPESQVPQSRVPESQVQTSLLTRPRSSSAPHYTAWKRTARSGHLSGALGYHLSVQARSEERG